MSAEPTSFSHLLALRPAMEARAPATRAADHAACAAVARQLAVESVEALSVVYEVAAADGVFRCRGEVRAEVIQACVVTGEPVAQTVTAPFERFLVVGTAPDAAGAAVDVDPDERDVDYLDAPVLDIGALAVEELALALDPYPRAHDADKVLAESNALVDDAATARRPFAVLARQRRPS